MSLSTQRASFLNLISCLLSAPTTHTCCSIHDARTMATLLGPPEIYTPKSTPTTAITTTTTEPDPCLGFFFHVIPCTHPNVVLHRLQLAWSHHPLTTLKLVCNLRAVRKTAKADRDGFYAAALSLHRHHPKTLASNVPHLAEFGYFEDLPEILYCLLEGSTVRKIQEHEKLQGTKRAFRSREEKRLAMAKNLLVRYSSDPDFRFLHDCVSDHFAGCLKRDLEFLNSGSVKKISLAAKWFPSLDSSYDLATLLCERVARRLFPREEYEWVEETHYAYRVRKRLRKEVLVPLRKALEFNAANRLELIPNKRVPSVAMKFYNEKYLEDVKAGKATIAPGALLPHEIIKSLWDGDGWEVAEL